MSITFFTAPMSSATPVTVVLAELGVPHETVVLDLRKGETRKPEFLALNPNGKVPTLVVDGTPIFEGLAIVQWVGDRYGVERGLWPAADSPARLEALSWTTWAYVTFGAACNRLMRATNERFAELTDAKHAAVFSREAEELLALLEARLAYRPFMLGAELSLVDLVVANNVKFGTYCGLSVDGQPHVKEWLATIAARPAFAASWG